MSMIRQFANAQLRLWLWAQGIPNVADNAVAAPLNQLYVALHTDDPGETGVQSTLEVACPGYARVAVPRSAAGCRISDDVASFANDVAFPASTGAGGTAKYFSIGTASSGAGSMWLRGTLTPNIGIASGVTPVVASETTMQLQ